MTWNTIPGAEPMTPLELNAIPLASEKHSPVSANNNADALPGASSTSQPIRKTSLKNLGQ